MKIKIIKNSKSNRIRIFLLILILYCLLFFTSDKLTENHILYSGKWQHFEYLKVVETFPEIYKVAPFCYRLLLPLLIYILPIKYEYSFFLVTNLSIVFTAFIIYLIIFEEFKNIHLSILGVITYFSLTFVVRFNILEFISIDAFTFLFLSLCFFAIQRKKYCLVILFSVIGILIKELFIFIPFLYFTYNYLEAKRNNELKNLIKKSFLILISVSFIFILLHLLIIPVEKYNYFQLLLETVKFRIDTFVGIKSTLNYEIVKEQPQFLTSIVNIYRITFGGVGPILFFIILYFKDLKKLIFKYFPIFMLGFFQLLIAGDNERIIASGFVAYILLFMYSLEILVLRGIKLKYIYFFVISLYLMQLIFYKNIYYQFYYSVAFQNLIGFLFIILVRISLKNKKLLSN